MFWEGTQLEYGTGGKEVYGIWEMGPYPYPPSGYPIYHRLPASDTIYGRRCFQITIPLPRGYVWPYLLPSTDLLPYTVNGYPLEGYYRVGRAIRYLEQEYSMTPYCLWD